MAIISCQKEVISTNPSDRLSFSADTVVFDTVFSSIGSSTRNFMVYNRGNARIKISKVWLAGGSTSPYKINVDGEPGPAVNDIELASGDSIYVFVNVTVDPSNQDSPLAVEDSIMFNLNGNVEAVKLLSWGQDVVLLDGSIVTSQTFTAAKPYLIYNSALVPEGAVLTVDAGARFFFHNNSRLYVQGKMVVNGTFDNPVSFMGDRLEGFYQDKAGQWAGIYFTAGSSGNLMNWCDIKNAITGVQVDTFKVANEATLTITNTRVENMSAFGLLARGAIVNAGNCLFANCGQATVALTLGGNYEFNQCTMANYWGDYYSRKYPQLWLNNYYLYQPAGGAFTMVSRDIERADFYNCIVYGSMSNEVWVDTSNNGMISSAKMVYQFVNSVVKIPSGQTMPASRFINVLTDDPKFIDPQNFSYLLDTLSPAKDLGLLQYGLLFPMDLKGDSRIADGAPDAGAFERV
ncbi:MAG TPA: hypothetical protein VMV56_08375, partial [Williamwhitmania sp.]|nr:hypothetical protein [Williamwhitmania sp.]